VKRSRFLTHILSRAVSGVRVVSAEIVGTDQTEHWIREVVPGRTTYWIRVDPDHYTYWKCFKEAHPNWKQIAYKYRTIPDLHCFCPEFTTAQDLMNWLFDVLELTHSERNLLRLWGGVTDDTTFNIFTFSCRT